MFTLILERLAGVAWVVALAAVHPAPAGARVDSYRPSADDLFDGGNGAALSEDPWWTGFGDPALTEVMDRGLTGNGDLSAAWSRVEQSRAMAWGTLAPQLPSLSLDVAGNVAPTESLGFQFGGIPTAPGADEPPDLYYTGSATLNARVPIDYWGRQVQTYRASRFEAQAAEGDGDAQAIALTTLIGLAYYDATAARAQVALLERQVAAQESLLELTRLRYQQTDSSGLEVLQQRQQLAATMALLPTARAQERTRLRQLAALMGTPSADSLPDLPAALPDLPSPPGTGRPIDLLLWRPDLRAAGARLSAATSRRHGSAMAFLPAVALTGQVGTQAIVLDETDTQDVWGAGVALSLPILEGTGRFAGLKEARAAEDGAARAFGQRLLEAVEQVESALIVEHERTERRRALERQLDAAQAAADESRARYAQGLTSYLTVLTAVTAQHQAELGVLQAQRELIDARIRLHESLGGRWTARLDSPGREGR